MTEEKFILLAIGVACGLTGYPCLWLAQIVSNKLIKRNDWLFLLGVMAIWMVEMLLIIEVVDALLSHLVTMCVRRESVNIFLIGFIAGFLSGQRLVAVLRGTDAEP